MDVSLDKVNDIGDKDFLYEIRGSDNKCTNMVVPDYVHSQKACTSTHTSPCGAVMTQLISCLDESLFRDGAMSFVTFIRN